MKFPRNARIFRGQLDAAPFAAVFFLLVIFLMLASLLYTPGVRLELPVAGDLPGVEGPTLSVAIDGNGRLYFENQWIEENELKLRLRRAAARSPSPLTLVVQADKSVSYERLVHLSMLAHENGISHALLATLPRPFGSSGSADSP
jgi:biopolymer transport protein ExbD